MALLEVSEDVAAVDADRWAAMDMDGAALGLVVKYLVANEMPRVRFPDGAFSYASAPRFCSSQALTASLGVCGYRYAMGWIEMALLEVSEDVAAVDADRWAAMDMDGA
ncbi:hypothetical protein DVH05_023237, partial [Phytophthora capsici]